MRTSPFFVKKLRRLSAAAEFISKFIDAGVLPLNLKFYPPQIPGLLKHDFAQLKSSIKLISQVCGLSFSYLTNLVCESHINASFDFAELVPGDHQYPYTMIYQRQGRTPPPGAVSSCFPRRLLQIGILSFRRYHDSWLTEMQS